MPNTPINKLSLGQELFIIEKGRIKVGRVCGYKAEFYAPWNEWAKNFQEDFSVEKHKLLEVCLNFKSETAINGNNEWLNPNSLFLDRKSAEKKLEITDKEERNKKLKQFNQLKTELNIK